jgi:transcriptional regulator with XRE-family HTH domain
MLADVLKELKLLPQPEKNLGSRLRLLRQASGLNLHAAAQKIGLHYTSLQAAEAGNDIRWSTLVKIAEGYGLRVMEILDNGKLAAHIGRVFMDRENSIG